MRAAWSATLAAVAWAAVAALSVAGCSASARPSTLPPASPTVVSPTPSPSPLTQAEIAQQAIATVKAYYAEVDHAIKTGDTSHLRRMSTPNCVCLKLVDFIESVWRTGSVRGTTFFILGKVTPHDVSSQVASV